MTDRKALEYAQALVDFCKSQRGCQNCIFRLHGSDHWKCQMNIDLFDMREAEGNIEAKRKNGGYI
jgi:hypothetical protein